MSDERPPRLIDDPAYRDALTAVRKESAMTPERLAANKRAIEPALSQPPPSGTSLGTVALTIAGLAGLMAIAFVVAPAFEPLFTPDEPRVEGTDTPAEETPIRVDGATSVAIGSPVETPIMPGPPKTPWVTPGMPAPTPDLARHVEPPAPTPASGTLADELALYDAARSLAKSGDDAGALAKLDELARRFPVTTLAPEAAITRAEVLVQARRLDEASALLAKLVTEPVHAGRRAELERTLGDVERERGDCDSARTHYRASLDAGAKGDEASAVRRGLGMCEAQ